ncbi:GNAT domain-containing protein [Echria macrotheca]|uniref:GNAT domain-containing protein n=1 Tax=Echria macrotheca TaxID=438768 RepID=A0AAJ0F4X9_9PEZI|nr:GNAT domain-containing protein [Echria macrotheca]
MSSTDEPQKLEHVVVKSTLPRQPLPLNVDRRPIITERLTIRAFDASDLDALHELRRQPEVMKWTMQGRIDHDKEETQARLDVFLPPNDAKHYNYAICLKETGEFIGIGGFHGRISSFGWPEVGYMLKREFWGKGYATEFLKAWLVEYEKLPREEIERSVDPRSVVPIPAGDEDGEKDCTRAREVLIAVTEESNPRSHNILRKCGFELFCTWITTDSKDPDGVAKVVLPTFRYLPAPRS